MDIKTISLIAIIIALLVSGQINKNETENDQYCDRVSDYIESNGEYGWPDYKNNYEKYCK